MSRRGFFAEIRTLLVLTCIAVVICLSIYIGSSIVQNSNPAPVVQNAQLTSSPRNQALLGSQAGTGADLFQLPVYCIGDKLMLVM